MGIFKTNALKEKYEILEELGRGNFATVKRAKNKSTGEIVAVKILTVNDDEEYGHIKAEIEILEKLESPQIIKIHEIFEKGKVSSRTKKVYIVMEFVAGGELFDRIVKHKSFKESEARSVVKTVIKGLQHAHKLGIAHRDLKPENLLMANKDEDDFESVKVADWGLAKLYNSQHAADGAMQTMCGTPGYVAPEVLTGVQSGGYDSRCDMWSVGVILYVMLCGFLPFQSGSRERLFAKIKAGKFKFVAPYWDNISPSAKDLVSKMLMVDPDRRITNEEVLEHPWMNADKALIDDHLLNIDELKHFNDYIHAQKKWRSFVHAMLAVNRLNHLAQDK